MKHLWTLVFLCLCLVQWVKGQKVQHLGRQINSVYDEREPVISRDGNTLYFWRRVSPANTAGLEDFGDIWFSEKMNNGMWSPARRMPPPLNSRGHDFVWKATKDTLWMTQVPEGTRLPGLAYSVKNRFGSWGNPRNLSIKNFDSKGSVKDYFLADNGILLIPNEGEKSLGGSDLYVCFPISSTQWSEPVNLGPDINTYLDEDAPYLSKDGRTLFFNSNGHGGYGDHDIFMSERIGEGWQHWTKPVNLGPPVNTDGYDYDFYLSTKEDLAFWGSEERSIGKGDIFSLNLQQCEVDIYPQGNQQICEGDTLKLEAGFSWNPNISFQWMRDGQFLPGETDRELMVFSSGSYQLLKRTNFCSDTSGIIRVEIKPRPIANVTAPASYICEGDSIMLWAGRNPSYKYQWKRNGLALFNGNNPGFYAKSQGIYTVDISQGNCTVESEEYELSALSRPVIFQAGNILPNSMQSLPEWLWSNQVKTTKKEIVTKDMTIDNKGNVYLYTIEGSKGNFQEYLSSFFDNGPLNYREKLGNTLDFSDRYIVSDPNQNVILSSNERYLAKYSRQGKLLWQLSHHAGQLSGLAVDEAGFIYVAGRFKTRLSIDGHLLEPDERGSMFIAKHSPSGRLVWVNSFPVDGYKADFQNNLFVDRRGNVYIADGYEFIANFRQKVLKASLTRANYFLLKLGQDGTFQWAQKIIYPDKKPTNQDVYVDKDGKSTILLEETLFRFNNEGNSIFEGPLQSNERLKNANVVSYLDNLYVFGQSGNQSAYTLLRLYDWGKPIALWKSSKTNITNDSRPLISMSDRQEIFIASTGKQLNLPGKNLTPSKNAPLFLAKYGKPRPRNDGDPFTYCYEEGVDMVIEGVRGMRYQWMKAGVDIPGAQSYAYRATEPGSYQVKMYSNTCESISFPQSVLMDCGPKKKRPDPAPILASRSEEPIQVTTAPIPVPEEVIPPDVEELERDSQGAPLLLNDREIVSQREVKIKSRTVRLELWDSEIYDQDTVSLNINGQWVLQNYCLLNERKEINYTFPAGSTHNFIILYAHNLGLKPPNTASLMIDDGSRKRILNLRSTLDNCGMLEITFD